MKRMLVNRILAILCRFAVLLAVLAFIAGCASTSSNYDSSSDDITDIDDLLGLGSEDESSIGEDDVMQLLGIAEEAASDAAFAEEKTPDEMAQELNTLETRRSDLNTQTQQLENKITEQESRIASLEQSGTGATPPAVAAERPAQTGYAGEYQSAFRLYKNKKYREAIQAFEALLTQNASHQLSDNAQYWIAESYYGMGNYQKAIASFEKVFIYTDSNKDDAAQLKIGMCYLRLNDREKAGEELQKLVNNYPTSESVGLARRLLEQIGTAAP